MNPMTSRDIGREHFEQITIGLTELWPIRLCSIFRGIPANLIAWSAILVNRVTWQLTENAASARRSLTFRA